MNKKTVSQPILEHYPAFDDRWYRPYFCCQILFILGIWIQSTALPILVFRQTGDVLQVGLVTASQALPTLLLGLFTSTIVDCLPKKRLAIIAAGLMPVNSAVIVCLVLVESPVLAGFVVAAFLAGTCNSLAGAAQNSMLAEYFGKPAYLSTVKLSFVSTNLARVLGALSSTWIMVNLGFGMVFGLSALCFMPLVVSLACIHHSGTEPAKLNVITFGKNLISGVRYVSGNRSHRYVLGMVACMGIFAFNFSVLLPGLLVDDLEVSSERYGVMVAFLAGGSLVGSVASSLLKSRRNRVLCLHAVPVCSGLLLVSLGLCTYFAVALPLMTLIGFCNMIFFSQAFVELQSRCRQEFRARLNAFYAICFGGMSPVGNTVSSHLARQSSSSTTLILFGTFLAVVFIVLYMRRTVHARASKRYFSPGSGF